MSSGIPWYGIPPEFRIAEFCFPSIRNFYGIPQCIPYHEFRQKKLRRNFFGRNSGHSNLMFHTTIVTVSWICVIYCSYIFRTQNYANVAENELFSAYITPHVKTFFYFSEVCLRGSWDCTWTKGIWEMLNLLETLYLINSCGTRALFNQLPRH